MVSRVMKDIQEGKDKGTAGKPQRQAHWFGESLLRGFSNKLNSAMHQSNQNAIGQYQAQQNALNQQQQPQQNTMSPQSSSLNPNANTPEAPHAMRRGGQTKRHFNH